MDWVRTSDGWESSAVIQLDPFEPAEPAIHPTVIACLQLGLSLFALVAFPGQGRPKTLPAAGRVKRVRISTRRQKTAVFSR